MAPLLAFLLVVFVVPIGTVLYFSVDNPEVGALMPRTTAALAQWDGARLPAEAAYAALAADLREGYANKTIAKAALRLNYSLRGFRSMVMRTARAARRFAAPYRAALVERDARWDELAYWRTIKSASSRFTAHYLLAALDLELQWDGSVERAPQERRVYVDNLARTLWMSSVVTLICLLVGFPLAYLVARAEGHWATLLLVLLLLPFWTSLLVRTAAWVVLLQKEGIVNDALILLRLVDQPLQLIFNRVGVYIAMTHILLPFMVLPIYSVMKRIPSEHLRAAASLGARPTVGFLTIYLPQTVPGIGAGCLLVFVLAIGFYITPALVGGGSDQMLSYLIAQFALRTANWGMAGALAVVLLVTVGTLFVVFGRLTRIGRVSAG